MSAKGANYFLQLKQRAKNSPVGAGEKKALYIVASLSFRVLLLCGYEIAAKGLFSPPLSALGFLRLRCGTFFGSSVLAVCGVSFFLRSQSP
jgi:hypothetical protein